MVPGSFGLSEYSKNELTYELEGPSNTSLARRELVDAGVQNVTGTDILRNPTLKGNQCPSKLELTCMDNQEIKNIFTVSFLLGSLVF